MNNKNWNQLFAAIIDNSDVMIVTQNETIKCIVEDIDNGMALINTSSSKRYISFGDIDTVEVI